VLQLHTPPPSPPIDRQHAANVITAESQPFRVAHSYPFAAISRIKTAEARDVGKVGEEEGEERDPLLLRTKVLGAQGLHRRTSKNKKLHQFYSVQNNRISALLKPLVTHAQEHSDAERAHRVPVKFAIRASLVCNCILAALQIYAAVSSLSLSFFASAIDAM